MEEEEHIESVSLVANKRRKVKTTPAEKISTTTKKRPSPDTSKKTKKKSRTKQFVEEKENEKEKEKAKGKEKEKVKEKKKEKEPEDEQMSGTSGSEEKNASGIPIPPAPVSEAAKQANDALQQLLRRSSGLDNSSNRSRLASLIDGVKAEGDLARQMDSLIELCDYLSMSTEDTLAGFRPDTVVPTLTNLLNYEDNPEIMIYAARALTYMMEALPTSCASVVSSGAVSIFCEKLLVISYIDVAEQCLQALEKLSAEHPNSILKAGGLMALLSFLDFFSSGVKRSAVNTAANVCRYVPVDSFNFVSDAVVILSTLLSDPDQKVVEGACLCFARLVESFQDYETQLQELASNGLLDNVMRIIGSNPPTVTPPTFTLLIRLLTNVAHGSASLALSMIQQGIATIIQSTLSLDSNYSSRSEQILEVLSLVNELLPQIPAELLPPQILTLFSARPVSRSSILRKKRYGEAPHPATTPSSKNNEADLNKVKMFEANPQLISSLEFLFEPVVKVYNSTVNTPVKNKSILIILKLIFFSTPESLTELLRNVRISSFVASQLSSRDLNIVLTALKLSEVLISKLPNIFDKYFKREGVLFEIETLSRREMSLSIPSSPIGKEKEAPSSPSATPATPSAPSTPSASSSTPTRSALRSPSALLNFLTAQSPLSPSTLVQGPGIKDDELSDLVVTAAKKFKSQFFKAENQSDDLESLIATKELVQLRELSTELLGVHSPDKELQILQSIRELITRKESVSTFEFLQSKAGTSLIKYMSSADLETKRQRWKTFCLAFCTHLPQLEGTALPFIVRRLQDALNTSEKFHVIVNDAGTAASGLSFLTQPFKLRLQKDKSDKSDIKDYGTNIVLIEPLATINAIEEFLWARVKTSPAAQPKSPEPKSDEKKTPQSPSTPSMKIPERRKLETIETPNSPAPVNVSTSEPEPNEEDTDGHEDQYDDYDDYAEEEEYQEPDRASMTSSGGVLDVKLNESGNRSLRDSASRVANASSSSSSTAQKKRNLVFYVDDKQLPYGTTVFQAVQQVTFKDQVNDIPINRAWEMIHTLKYKVYTEEHEREEKLKESESWGAAKNVHLRDIETTPLDVIFEKLPPRPAGIGDDTYETLVLLYFLEALNRLNTSLDANLFTPIAQSEFLNEKVNAKLLKQLQDPLTICSGSLPDWCKILVTSYKFVFPSESRSFYFNSTSFGIIRALHALQQHMETTPGEDSLKIGRITRQKVRVLRTRLLDSAIKVMDLFGKQKGVLEVEYFGEVGTGLGPTLEFYTCVSEELQMKKLKMWNDQQPDNKADAVYAPGGLFPSLINPKNQNTDASKKIFELFQFLGCFVAKAIMDSRILDLPLSDAFYKWMLGIPLGFEDLKDLMPEVTRSLEPLAKLSTKKHELKSSRDAASKLKEAESQLLNGSTVEDLCLDFTLPGNPDWELKPYGVSINVTLDNIEEYVHSVVENFLVTGVELSLQNFAKGFSSVFPMEYMQTFNIAEIDSTIGGEKGKWELSLLIDNVKCDHGYSSSSRAVEYFLQIISEFDLEQQRKFLLFVTGSPKLPVGGFKNLHPKLTIVRKDMQNESPDDYLPTVSSCFHYLKLPDYSTKDIMREKLVQAIQLGQGSFHLT